MPAFPSRNGDVVIDTRPIAATDERLQTVAGHGDASPDAVPAVARYRTVREALAHGADLDALQDAVVREAFDLMSDPYIDSLALQGYRDIGGFPGGWQGPGPLDMDAATRLREVAWGRMLALISPPAKNALRLHRTYVLGQGVPMPTSADSDVQDVIEDVWDDPDNAELTTQRGQAETDAGWLVTGELFLAIYVDEGDGHLKVRTVEPLDVDTVVTHPDDRKRILYYRVRMHRDTFNFAQGTAVDEIQPGQDDEYVYFPDWQNTDANAQTDPYAGAVRDYLAPGGAVMASFPLNRQGVRGIPEFAAATPWIVAHKRICENQSIMAEARKRIATIKTVKGGPGVVNRMAASEQSSISANGYMGGLERNPPAAPGATYVKNAGVDIDYPDLSTGAEDATRDAEMQAQMIGAALGWGTHYLLMSTEFHRLATAVTMELPTLKMCLEGQQRWLDMLKAVLDFALLKAAKAGRIKAPVVTKHGRQLVDWSNAEPAPIKGDDGAGAQSRTAPGGGDGDNETPSREADPTDMTAMAGAQHEAQKPEAIAKRNAAKRGHFIVDMPPVLERDVLQNVQAVEAAATGGHITPEQAAQEVMLIFGWDDTSDRMEDWRLYVETKSGQIEEEAAQQRAMAQQQVAAKAGANGPPKPTPTSKPTGPTRGADVPSKGMSAPQ